MVSSGLSLFTPRCSNIVKYENHEGMPYVINKNLSKFPSNITCINKMNGILTRDADLIHGRKIF